jgi:FkbM family methyltransferase
MMFDLKNLQIDILKKFDGQYNYFNPSHYNGRTIYRRESKYDNKILVSSIVDEHDNDILHHKIENGHLYSYEDARFINENEISVCVCIRKLEDLTEILNVEYKKYNLQTKIFTHYKTQKTHFEKHWQFYEDKIIYHVNPYTIMDNDENILCTATIDWNPWIEKYGKPGLSTNVFEVNNQKYLLFHSYINLEENYLKYYVGLLKLNDDLIPIGYFIDPLFEANKEYTDDLLLDSLWEWRNTELAKTVKYEVIFPMSVSVDDSNINIYSGLNDCSAVKITISGQSFIETIKNYEFVSFMNNIHGTIFYTKDTISYFYDSFKDNVKENDWCIDIGSNIGCSTKPLLDLVGPNGKVICFEPCAEFINKFKQNIGSVNNVDLYQFACSSEYSKKSYAYHIDNGGLVDEKTLNVNDHTYRVDFVDIPRYNATQEHVTLCVDTIDLCDFLNTRYKNQLHKIKFIKIDAEGFDCIILNNISPILKEIKPIIQIECWYELNEIIFNLADSIGYNVYKINGVEILNKTNVTSNDNNLILRPK